MGQPDQSQKLMSGIHESERPDSSLHSPPRKPRRLSDKLGLINLLVLGLGTLVVFTALAILLFAWIVSFNAVHDGSTPRLWVLFVRHQWTARVITLSSTVIRIATAAQLGIFTAIVAALILERVGAPRADFPKLSIMRCSNSGPNSLILTILGSIFTVPLLPYTILIVIAALDAFALQFTSTILLTDFSNAQVVLGVTTTPVHYGLPPTDPDSGPDTSRTNPYSGIDYYQTAPAAYNRFAEYQVPGSETAHTVDTGTTIRGFLPFRDSGNRSSLRTYTGPLTLADTRVVCVKPTISNITLDVGTGETPYTTFSAMYDWNNTHPDITGQGQFFDPFNCSIPTRDNLRDNYWASSVCSYYLLGNIPARLNGILPDPGSDTRPNGQTTIHMLVNATGYDEDWLRLKDENATLESVESSTGSWAHLQIDNVTMAVSLCFFNPNPSNYQVTVESPGDGNDTTIQWNSTAKAYLTSEVQDMLDATNKSRTAEQRGLLNLQVPSNWTAAKDDNIYKVDTSDFVWAALARTNLYSQQDVGETGQTSAFNELSINGDAVHRTLAAITQTILQETRNPALTLQAFWTILMQMSYYDFLPQFEISAPATYQVSSTVRIPTQWDAFAVVLGLLVLHFGLVLIALLLFLRTEMSLLGNSWQVISQVVSTDTADIVHHAATSTDKELMSTAKASGIDNDMIRIAKCENSGRVQAKAVRRQGDQA